MVDLFGRTDSKDCQVIGSLRFHGYNGEASESPAGCCSQIKRICCYSKKGGEVIESKWPETQKLTFQNRLKVKGHSRSFLKTREYGFL